MIAPPEVQKAISTLVDFVIRSGIAAYQGVFFPDGKKDANAAGFLLVALGTNAEIDALRALVTAELKRQGTTPRPEEAHAFKTELLPPPRKENT